MEGAIHDNEVIRKSLRATIESAGLAQGIKDWSVLARKNVEARQSGVSEPQDGDEDVNDSEAQSPPKINNQQPQVRQDNKPD